MTDQELPMWAKPSTVARMLDKDPATVSRWRNNPHLFPPSSGEGASRRYETSEIQRWMRAGQPPYHVWIKCCPRPDETQQRRSA